MEELIEKFSLDNVGKSAGVFNPEKLLWLNAHYIKNGDPQRLGELLRGYLAAKGIDPAGGPDLPAVVRTLQERSRTMVEMAEGAVFYFMKDVDFDQDAVAKFLTADKAPVFNAIIGHLEACEEWTHDGIGKAFAGVMEETGLKLGKFGPSVRVALVGGTTSPSIYEVIEVLGKSESLRRLKEALEMLR